MDDPGMNSLLKWSVEHSSDAQGNHTSQADPSRGLNAEALAQLLGGPTDADRMRDAMAAIVSPEVTLENKMVAFDNFEQLVENLDNANNMEKLGLWVPLVDQLDSKVADLRMMAAWCIGTSVQNNVQAQERALVLGVVPRLIKQLFEDLDATARRKAVFALSSEVRNYQPAYDEALKLLPSAYQPATGKTAADDMDEIDIIMSKLREFRPAS